MPQQDALALLAIAGIPIATGLGALALACRGRVPVVAVLLGVPLAMALSLVVAVPVLSQCRNSRNKMRAAAALLSPAERQTLRGSGLFCPGVLTFRRNGKTTCLVPDGEGGASVGCG